MDTHGSSMIKPDVSLVVEPVYPYIDEIVSVVNKEDVPIVVPMGRMLNNQSVYQSQEDSTGSMTLEERRKQRNREASRKYRERARRDPELLKKMREQQNARQKKYYARLRMKKLSSEEWDTSLEEGQWSA